jgi:hypothetical protein
MVIGSGTNRGLAFVGQEVADDRILDYRKASFHFRAVSVAEMAVGLGLAHTCLVILKIPASWRWQSRK